jgi:hypothetical protein
VTQPTKPTKPSLYPPLVLPTEPEPHRPELLGDLPWESRVRYACGEVLRLQEALPSDEVARRHVTNARRLVARLVTEEPGPDDGYTLAPLKKLDKLRGSLAFERKIIAMIDAGEFRAIVRCPCSKRVARSALTAHQRGVACTAARTALALTVAGWVVSPWWVYGLGIEQRNEWSAIDNRGWVRPVGWVARQIPEYFRSDEAGITGMSRADRTRIMFAHLIAPARVECQNCQHRCYHFKLKGAPCPVHEGPRLMKPGDKFCAECREVLDTDL